MTDPVPERVPVAYIPIGIIRSGHREASETPIQPVYADGCDGYVEVYPEYEEGLRDLEGFSHIYLIYHFHRAGPPKLIVTPFLQDAERGIFATRAPTRPNPVGISIVQLVRREGALLYIDGMDILDGTPLLDIKPYTAKFDCIRTARNGWQDEVDEETARRRGSRRDPSGARKKRQPGDAR